ncbi:hypothetical protein MBLNU459_g3767t1 [Dothideomycetes sp. NU459]
MLCLRCTGRIAQAARPSPSSLLRPALLLRQQPVPKPQSRTFTLLTRTRPTLPSAPTSTLSLSTTLELPTSAASPSITGTLLQARGPKRDTYDPSHRVRKRRHGFLARIRTRTGRALIKRRRLKLRTTMGH